MPRRARIFFSAAEFFRRTGRKVLLRLSNTGDIDIRFSEGLESVSGARSVLRRNKLKI